MKGYAIEVQQVINKFVDAATADIQ